MTCLTDDEMESLGEATERIAQRQDEEGSAATACAAVSSGRAPSATRLYGRCYLVPAADREGVLDNLDFREKGGYTRAVVDVVHGTDPGVTHRALLYTANAANPGFLGPAPLNEIASTLAFTVGPSGPNIEYARNLISYMRMSVPGYSEDEDQRGERLFELETAIDRALQKGIHDVKASQPQLQ